MKKLIRWYLPLLFAFLINAPVLAEDSPEGAKYLTLKSPQPTASTDKIEVVELFWYGCPHCFRLEPHLQKWKAKLPDDVDFIRLPAILGPSWELFARAYFSAELLGVTDKIHKPLFEAIHTKKQKIRTEDKVRQFFVDKGVSEADFNKTFKSFAVAVKVNNARLMTKRYAITGVPTLIVNGKYSTTASLAGGNPKVIQVVNDLVEQERQLLGQPAAPGLATVGQ